ncbi:MAG: prolyl oligopeptidase family serine peptidase [Blastocatellia bacterium]|nr:prolyl oligopeptidase family serine peptidase [Blastocatellia bacterium]
MSRIKRAWVAAIAAIIVFASIPGASAQKRFTIENVLSPAYPFEMVSAKKADRIAWIAYERGMRNVYTAAAPDFKPVRLTINLEDDGNDLTNLRISDDGSTVVFVRGHTPNRDGWIANPTSDPDGSERAIWAMKTAGGRAPRRLAVAASPALSPDGKWVLYTKEGQIYRVPVSASRSVAENGKGEKPLFRAFGNNGNPVWSPDSTRIAFVSNRGDHSLIGIYDLESRKISYLSPGVDRDTSPAWSHDGKRVAFIRRPGLPFGVQVQSGRQPFPGRPPVPVRRATPEEGAQRREIKGLTSATFAGGYTLSLWVGEVDTGHAREVWHNAPGDEGFASIRSIEWAGDNIIFLAEPKNWRHYYSIPVSGSSTEPIDLTPGDGIAEQVGLSSDGQYLYYSTNVGDIDRRHIWKTPTRGGTPVQLTTGDEMETYPAVLASGDKVAILSAAATRPQSVAVMGSSGGKPKIIFPTLKKDFPADQHVVPENVTLTAEDGVKFHNQVFVPKDIKPGERRPAILFTHGGPQRQMLLGYHYRHFYHMAYAINQYFASRGYVVISVNYRSGIGYGKAFRNAEKRGARGNSEYRDVQAAGKYLQGRPDVDPKRIGLWGLSYGGILTAQGLARNSDIFAAGVDIAGVHLWGNSIDPKSVSYQSSSIAAIEKWKSPVLLIHGDDDRNVAFSQTTGLVQLLRAHNVPHELIVFPDDVHDFLLHSRWLTAFNAMDEFFNRHLRSEELR